MSVPLFLLCFKLFTGRLRPKTWSALFGVGAKPLAMRSDANDMIAFSFSDTVNNHKDTHSPPGPHPKLLSLGGF
jgi:hypothetical protein